MAPLSLWEAPGAQATWPHDRFFKMAVIIKNGWNQTLQNAWNAFMKKYCSSISIVFVGQVLIRSMVNSHSINHKILIFVGGNNASTWSLDETHQKNRCMGMAQFALVPAVHSFSWYLWMFIYRFIWLVIIGWTHFLEKNIIETHSINDIQATYIRRKIDLVQFTDVYHVLGVAVY